MEAEDTTRRRVHRDQITIPVPSAPGAVGRWTGDEEINAYKEQFGEDAALEQHRRAELEAACNCGEQEKENIIASHERRKAQRVLGHKHLAGCKAFRAIPKSHHTPTEEDVKRGW